MAQDRRTAIAFALSRLDPANDQHWTSDGLPLVEAVANSTGFSMTRKEISDAAPMFTRQVAAQNQSQAAPTATHDVEPIAPTQDPAAAAPEAPAVAPVAPDVLSMNLSEIMRSKEMIETVLAALELKVAEALERKKAADKELSGLYKMVDILSRQHSRMVKSDPNAAMQPIQAYLAQSQKAREERAARAKAFIDAHVSPEAVKEQFEIKSKIDRVMAARKPGIGSQRHEPRIPSGVQ